MFQYEGQIVRVIDGDTLQVDIDLGFYVRIKEIVRLARVNAPDLVGFDAKGVNDPAARWIFSHCPPGSVVVLGITRAEKYGRWLAEVWYKPGVADRNAIMQNPCVLNDDLVREGLAMPYDGGRK
jgi:micrococcal nuclease